MSEHEAQPAEERAARLLALQGHAATVILKIGGMSCAGCVGGVTAALQGVGGVADVQVNLEAGTAVVGGDASIARFKAQRLVEAVQAAGKEASLLHAGAAAAAAPSAAAEQHGHGHAAAPAEDHSHGHSHGGVPCDGDHGGDVHTETHGHGHAAAAKDEEEDHHHGQ